MKLICSVPGMLGGSLDGSHGGVLIDSKLPLNFNENSAMEKERLEMSRGDENDRQP